jgi:hypothetical protein
VLIRLVVMNDRGGVVKDRDGGHNHHCRRSDPRRNGRIKSNRFGPTGSFFIDAIILRHP